MLGSAHAAGPARIECGLHLLTRRVRFAVNPGPRPEVASHNGYAGRPAMSGLGRHYELEVACRGELARDRGYLIDIQDIDRVLEPFVQVDSALHRKLKALGID